MKASAVLFRVTAIVVFLQLLLGGLLTFDFISPEPHIIAGFLVFFLAIATMAAALVSRPPFRPMQILSVVLVLLVIVQIILGFETLATDSQFVAWLHFVTALAIFGVTISGTFMALKWNHMAGARSGQ